MCGGVCAFKYLKCAAKFRWKPFVWFLNYRLWLPKSNLLVFTVQKANIIDTCALITLFFFLYESGNGRFMSFVLFQRWLLWLGSENVCCRRLGLGLVAHLGHPEVRVVCTLSQQYQFQNNSGVICNILLLLGPTWLDVPLIPPSRCNCEWLHVIVCFWQSASTSKSDLTLESLLNLLLSFLLLSLQWLYGALFSDWLRSVFNRMANMCIIRYSFSSICLYISNWCYIHIPLWLKGLP